MNNNNPLKQNNPKLSFLKCTSGAVAIAMAIMLPAIFTCMTFSINQSYTMKKLYLDVICLKIGYVAVRIIH